MSIYSKNQLVGKLQNLFFKRHFESKYCQEFFSGAEEGLSNGKTAVIYAGIPYMYITPFEVLLYKILRSRGWNVIYLIYDNNVEYHELTTSKFSYQQRKQFVASNSLNGESFLKSSGVVYQHIAHLPFDVESKIDQLDSLSSVLAFEYSGCQIGRVVERVLFRYFKSVTIDDHERSLEVAKNFLKTSIRNFVSSKSLVESERIDLFLFSHGVYCTWEPVLNVCQDAGVDFACYDRGKTKNTININWNQSATDWSFDAAWAENESRSLTEKEASAVVSYLKERELQQGDVYSYNFKEKNSDIDSVREALGVPKDAKVLTFFTNLVWDAANVDRDEAFPTFVDAIRYASERYKDRSDVYVLVRTHPAEIVLGTNQKYQDLVADTCVNVIVIDESMSLNSFTVLDLTDIAITHTSTVGLEMAMTGKPSIVLGKTHYKSKGFTLDPSSPDEFGGVLDDLLSSEGEVYSDSRKALADKYFYMMMFLYQKRIPVRYKGVEFDGYEYSTMEELVQQDEVMKFLIDDLESDKRESFLRW